jgi:hypothetical protein
MHDHPSERRAASAPTKSRYAQNCSLFPKGNRSPASPAHLKKTTHTFFTARRYDVCRPWEESARCTEPRGPRRMGLLCPFCGELDSFRVCMIVTRVTNSLFTIETVERNRFRGASKRRHHVTRSILIEPRGCFSHTAHLQAVPRGPGPGPGPASWFHIKFHVSH